MYLLKVLICILQVTGKGVEADDINTGHVHMYARLCKSGMRKMRC